MLPRPEDAIHSLPAPRPRELDQLLRLRVPVLVQLVHLARVVRKLRRRLCVCERVQALRLHERRVGERDLAPDAMYEGQEGGVDIERAPADGHSVDGDDEGGVPTCLRAREDGEREFVLNWPAGR